MFSGRVSHMIVLATIISYMLCVYVLGWWTIDDAQYTFIWWLGFLQIITLIQYPVILSVLYSYCPEFLFNRKKSILLPSLIHFVHLTPSTKFRLTLLPSIILFGPIYSPIIFLFFVSLWISWILSSNFVSRYKTWCLMLKNYTTKNFHDYFHRLNFI
jgi:hypothetical protein